MLSLQGANSSNHFQKETFFWINNLWTHDKIFHLMGLQALDLQEPRCDPNPVFANPWKAEQHACTQYPLGKDFMLLLSFTAFLFFLF